MAKLASSIVTQAMIDEAQGELDNIASIEAELSLAEQAGLDVGTQREDANETKKRLIQFINTYKGRVKPNSS